MTDEEFDDALDGLPLHKRNKILRLVEDNERAPPKRLPHRSMAGRVLVMIFAFMWSIPFTLVGMVLVITVVAAPLGFLLLFIGAYPFYKAIKTWIRQSVEKEFNNGGSS